jgi:sulfur-oxidizing protein SoxA
MRRALFLAGSLALAAAHADETVVDARRSGFDFMTPQTQTLQRDDALNPGMLWVSEGADLWNKSVGTDGRSCASCHGDAAVSMRSVAARYPAFDTTDQRVVDLGARIQRCRVRHQRASAFVPESNELLSLQSFVAQQSRGMPIAPDPDPRLAAALGRGRELYVRHIGQLDLSCAECHDDRAGQRLGGSVITQAHPTGYPIYRLEWQSMGSLQRRLRGCMSGVRAEPYAYGAQELVELELYLATRAAGMLVETPAIRP